MKIELEIEQLCLHGIPAGDRFAVAAAVKHQLTQLLAERGLPQAWREAPTGVAIARLDGGTFEIAANAGAQHTGSEIARAVFGAGGVEPEGSR